ncbi:TetR/AcrR family transcriptional regulator C-terminal domain-containing protein [Actinoplanes sp. NBRC 103695]|uniref:TetR/AcrR family transcriptional regulator n=1 Tax=Actinoplanes sp. NBRC 103695 TaxID=3032202 RepID=UPI0024A11CC8|nr:TetR/AcrR family transcriptional regulator C-terminal domain-containing protein [Actinoplanes sp. NBRC 103695]GLY94558.1 TetR family transcriptional regulator [Actinoplanes sp. NBRC 103695]
MPEFSGRSDPDRILPLLWRRTKGTKPRTTGRPSKLTVDAVVTTAIARADTDGLESTSMARLATDLNVGTMTLYSYVPSHDELVDLMIDEVLLSRDLPGPGDPRPAHWREQVMLYADRTLAMYAAHPWMGQVSQIRPPIGPGMLAESEYVLSCLTFLDDPNTAAGAIQMFVTGAARGVAETELLRRASGETTNEWWLHRSQLWEDWFDVERHPTMTALWNAGRFTGGPDEQADAAYAYGLGLILDGINPG